MKAPNDVTSVEDFFAAAKNRTEGWDRMTSGKCLKKMKRARLHLLSDGVSICPERSRLAFGS